MKVRTENTFAYRGPLNSRPKGHLAGVCRRFLKLKDPVDALGDCISRTTLGDTLSWAGQAEIVHPDLAAVARIHPERERKFRVVCRKTGVGMQWMGCQDPL
ncbi:hypothetical protein NSERKGN1266_64360 [Nocardia seriolae]|uniref:hypothetical protein n=1 Tax=Nocardia seriolae TaxID=37332 RepID=UPI00051A06C8|nr:hypothetical protein [Nocardia seriolae]OJF78858.1 hypothetical protein NS14008_06095 [Nocardia seriolae]PSK26950.1 hypothetical protein C6575_34540 [Nocardia seriolae]RLP23836.1 hypothetical protein D6158_34430 [Nocardia seriolae]BEK90485.1 hypothetical protein NSERKGN1266_64360 [Nocardia seriolae]